MCICATVAGRRFDCVERAVYTGPEMAALEAGCELVADAPARWMRVYRCRECGTAWVEAWATSGQMDIKHFYPCAEAQENPQEWLLREGRSLPLRRNPED